LLGSEVSSDETASGWQQVNLATPISISANTTYVASYHTNGHFAYDSNAFTSSGIEAPPRHLRHAGVAGPTGASNDPQGGPRHLPTPEPRIATPGMPALAAS